MSRPARLISPNDPLTSVNALSSQFEVDSVEEPEFVFSAISYLSIISQTGRARVVPMR